MPRQCLHCSSKSNGIFCQLETDNLKGVIYGQSSRSLNKGERLFSEGSSATGLYCIGSGNLKILKTSKDGKTSIVRIAKKGDIVGLSALIGNQYYHSSAVALGPTEVCYIKKESILELMSKQPLISTQIIQHIGKDLGESEGRLASSSQKTVKERVLDLLVRLEEAHSRPHPLGRELTLNLTREEMAEFVGTATETLIRVLSELKKEKVIAKSGRSLVLVHDVS